MHALQFEDEQFQILDLGLARIELGLLRQDEPSTPGIERVEVGKLSLAFALLFPRPYRNYVTPAFRWHEDSRTFSRRDVLDATDVPGSYGLRQSMPSSSIDNCARLNDTTPWSALGQTKRPRSKRLANRQSRHHPPENFDEIARLPRKTKTWPEYGSVRARFAR